jgi:hypothetical protein
MLVDSPSLPSNRSTVEDFVEGLLAFMSPRLLPAPRPGGVS